MCWFISAKVHREYFLMVVIITAVNTIYNQQLIQDEREVFFYQDIYAENNYCSSLHFI